MGRRRLQQRIARPRVDRAWVDYLIGGFIGLLIGLAFFAAIYAGLVHGMRELGRL